MANASTLRMKKEEEQPKLPEQHIVSQCPKKGLLPLEPLEERPKIVPLMTFKNSSCRSQIPHYAKH